MCLLRFLPAREVVRCLRFEELLWEDALWNCARNDGPQAARCARRSGQINLTVHHSIMGMILCNEHGKTGVVLVCRHIQKACAEGLPLPSHEDVMVDLMDDPSMLMRVRLCDSCMISYGLSKGVVLTDFPEGLEPVCAKCLDQRERG